MGTMVDSLLWVMQDFDHQPSGSHRPLQSRHHLQLNDGLVCRVVVTHSGSTLSSRGFRVPMVVQRHQRSGYRVGDLAHNPKP